MKTVAVVGVGLIGASFALALRKAGFTGEVLGVSSERSLAAGAAVGAVDRGVTLEQAASSADLIYLSQPIDQILETLKTLGPIARPECVITDAGSTKTEIVKTARKHVRSALFIGGHPMAGKEQRGAAAADPELFRGRPYVITASPAEDIRIRKFVGMLGEIGAEVIQMSPEKHDQTVALTSHLPQLLSTALACVLSERNSEEVSRVFGPGLVDMTRLALSTPEVWMSVLQTNKSAVLAAISAYEVKLKQVRNHLQSGDLSDEFRTGADFAARVRKLSSSTSFQK